MLIYKLFFTTMEVNGTQDLLGYKHSSKYLPLCSAAKRNLTGLEQLESK